MQPFHCDNVKDNSTVKLNMDRWKVIITAKCWAPLVIKINCLIPWASTSLRKLYWPRVHFNEHHRVIFSLLLPSMCSRVKSRVKSLTLTKTATLFTILYMHRPRGTKETKSGRIRSQCGACSAVRYTGANFCMSIGLAYQVSDYTHWGCLQFGILSYFYSPHLNTKLTAQA